MAITDLDAHEQPTDCMKAKWKSYSKMDPSAFIDNTHIDDPRAPPSEAGFLQAGIIPASQLKEAFAQIDPSYSEPISDVPILYHPLLPGLLITSSLVPPAIQTSLLNKMLHRDLSNPKHQTNLHLHYELPYPPSSASFFSMEPESPITFTPKDPSVHKPLSARQVLQRRLHWVTLGGQYDWTNRLYPDQELLKFPEDISKFLQTLFPETTAQAAIVNFYTPGDTMMMHRDVSEFTDKGLVSLSLGCDGLFMIAPNDANTPDFGTKDEKEFLLLKLRSGDAIYMTNESRYAWHGVPKVLAGTCPDYLQEWPATEVGKYEDWRGWMKNKRINLNVRQMHD